MPITIDEYSREFLQEIYRDADAAPRLAQEAFFERFSDVLVDAGELPCADPSPYWHPQLGIRVDGYGGDPDEDSGTLSLIVADFQQHPRVPRLTRTAMEAGFRRLTRFLERALDARWRDSIEETSAGFRLAELVSARWNRVSRVRMFLITNRQLSDRVDGREAGEVEGRTVSYSVWDMGRLHRLALSEGGTEDLVIDFVRDFGGPLPVLPAHLGDAEYESFLAVIPGQTLAAIYDRWGARLLEQNVRVFLQARSKVNKGIKRTIETEPPMFFAYNNGLTATAEGADVQVTADGQRLARLQNFQIVNGGQTTASIHAAHRRKQDLSRVFVQMKLSIVDSVKAVEMVPRISEYANSQNRVNAADFFSNHPFHIRIEEFSRRIFVPSADGSFRQSKWFYERARGQYADASAHLTRAQRRRFRMEYPPAQKFQKTDLAKFVNVWRSRPHIVSLGAQKNFADFVRCIGKQWDRNSDDINEHWFREVIAKAIIFRTTEKTVSAADWYGGGYRANIVAYAISRVAHELEEEKQQVDFESIWQRQKLGRGLEQALARAAQVAHEALIRPPVGIHNVTEWAKKPACWKIIKAKPVSWPRALQAELVSRREKQRQQAAGRRDQRELNAIEAQIAVVQAGPAFWVEARGLPSEKQSVVAVTTLEQLNAQGYRRTLSRTTP